jgi:hypothetical protein
MREKQQYFTDTSLDRVTHHVLNIPSHNSLHLPNCVLERKVCENKEVVELFSNMKK